VARDSDPQKHNNTGLRNWGPRQAGQGKPTPTRAGFGPLYEFSYNLMEQPLLIVEEFMFCKHKYILCFCSDYCYIVTVICENMVMI
jgi:hypothetical protein